MMKCKRLITALILQSIIAFNLVAEEIPFFEKHTFSTDISESNSFYLSKGQSKNSPLLLFIQGSGCANVIDFNKDGVSTSIFNLFRIAERGDFSVLVVNKPFSGPLQPNRGQDVQFGCNKDFHRGFTVESWVKTINIALQNTLNVLDGKPKDVIVFGLSEGAGIASQVAVENKFVSHVIFTGGSGATQLFDFVLTQYQNCFDKSRCIEELYNTVEDIKKYPNSDERFAWGHPYKRWSSFFKLQPYFNLLNANVNVYLVFGTSDKATPVLSQELLAAQLMNITDKNVQIRRLPDAGHSLVPDGSNDYSYLENEFNLALEWYKKSSNQL